MRLQTARMRIPKTLTRISSGLAFSLSLFCSNGLAQEARFFRIIGPVVSTITDLSPDGTVTWMNEPTNATFTVQTRTDLAVGDWVDWVQVPATNAATVHRIFDPDPPAGMAFIPTGSFLMGATTNMGHESISDAVPQHTVYVSAFYMEKYEVTKALWDEVYQWATNHGYSFDNVGSGKASNHPVQNINWYDIAKWCNARSEKEGHVPAYYTSAARTTVYRTGLVDVQNDWVKWDANGYRLPTEAEWEKAARGGLSGRRFPWGNTISHSQANYCSSPSYTYDTSSTRIYHPTFDTGGTPYTSPVGSFAPNGYGLYDMAGNVYETCWDWYASDYYNSAPTSNPNGPASGSRRVAHGSAWSDFAPGCRMASRGGFFPDGRGSLKGFRCVSSQ